MTEIYLTPGDGDGEREREKKDTNSIKVGVGLFSDRAIIAHKMGM